MPTSKKIAIIGGGITGLTTAIALRKRGLDCTVFEKSHSLSEVGAGIWMQPNAMSVFERLGIARSITANGAVLNRAELCDRQLNPLIKTDDSKQLEQLFLTVCIHRARLQQVLFESLPEKTVKLSKSLAGLSLEGDSIELKFEDGSTEPCNILLAADGINSRVRQQLFPGASLRYSGQTSWRCITNFSLPRKYSNTGRECWGDRVRFGFSRVSEQEVYWFAVAKSKQNLRDDRTRLKSELQNRFRKYHPLVEDLIKSSTSDRIIRTDISDLSRLNTWSSGNVCLLGDAAHATTPNLGQGGCQGVEDGFFIAKFLSATDDCQLAFQNFERKRRQKVDYVVNTSWRFGKLAHLKMAPALMRTMLSITPKSIMDNRMRSLYALD